MEQKNNYNYEDLLTCAKGELFGPGNAQLPMPPMLMFEKITNISSNGGTNDKGVIQAEMAINQIYGFLIVILLMILSCLVA